ncbi:hypothetical protein B0H13DRAFT_2362741 [Mycena leptocephala]|nr:hypothetical protein B0H13DRAFT_2362741 [Mycena leptocephala]
MSIRAELTEIQEAGLDREVIFGNDNIYVHDISSYGSVVVSALVTQLVQGEGSKQAALAVLQYAYKNLNLYPVEGAKRPPADVALKSIDIGPHTIFYHRNYPVEVQAAHPFLWSFYIGHAGKGRGLIITDCAQENVFFSIQSGRGKWQNISTLVVLPRTTIRVSHLDSRGAATQEELVFPSDPREAPITSHHLQ